MILRICAATAAFLIFLAPAAHAAPSAAEDHLLDKVPPGFELLPESTGTTGPTSAMDLVRLTGKEPPAGTPDTLSGFHRTWRRGDAILSATALEWASDTEAAVFLAADRAGLEAGGSVTAPLSGVPDGTVATIIDPTSGVPMEMATFRRGPIIYMLASLNMERAELVALAARQSKRAGAGSTAIPTLPDLRRFVAYAALALTILAVTVIGIVLIVRSVSRRPRRAAPVALASGGWSSQLQ